MISGEGGAVESFDKRLKLSCWDNVGAGQSCLSSGMTRPNRC